MNDIRQFPAFDPARIRHATRDKVIFKRDQNPDKVGAIYVPGTSRYRDRSDTATVVAVGQDIDEVKAGDRLLLPDMLDVSGKFSHEGETYTVITREQLPQCAVIDEE